jgi:S1-C subfamily serine protease
MAILVAMIGAITVMFTAALPASHAGSTNALAGLEKSMVVLETQWTGRIDVPADALADHVAGYTKDVSYYTTCTGWYVSKSAEIVTAGHCVDPAQGRRVVLDEFLKENNATSFLNDALANWHVDGATQGSPLDRSVRAIQPEDVEGATITSPTTVQVVDFKPTDDGDVALLQVPDTATETPPLTIAGAAPQIGEPVTSIGFPGELREVADHSQIARASFKTGSVSSHQVTPQGVTKIEVSAALGPGMSGGPTVNRDGQVFGVNSSGLRDAANFNFITDTAGLRAFLASHDVETVQSNAPQAGMGVLWYAIGGVVVLISVLGATTLWLIRWRRDIQPAVAGGAKSVSRRRIQAGPTPRRRPGPARHAMPITESASPVIQTNGRRVMPARSRPADGALRNGAPPTFASNGNTKPASGDSLTATTRYCPACGAKHHHNGLFCPGCGQPTT